MNLQEIFSQILHMSLTGSYIILIVLLIRLALRKAPKVFSYMLWAVVLFRLLCPVSISSALSVLNFIPAAPSQPQGPVTTVEHPMILDIYTGISLESNTANAENIHHEPEFTPSSPENRVEPAPVPDAVDQQAAAEPVRDPLGYAVTIWLLGMGALFVYNIYAYLRLSQHTAGAVRLRKNIYLGDHIPTPFVKGLIRPKIYLPSTLAEAERKYIIAHERCHIRRKDPIWKLLGYIALCVHWFNPLVWLAFTLSAKDMEMSCDEAVISMYGSKIRAEYSASLLRLATGHRFVALTPLAFGEGDTKGRVMNMAKWKKPGFWAMLCAAIVCIAVLAACATNPSETIPQATNETTAPVGVLQIEAADAMAVCTDALKQLKSAESYYIVYEFPDLYDSNSRMTMDYRRHGNNIVAENPEGDALIGNWIIFDGKYGMFYGDFWVLEEEETTRNANDWLRNWSLEGKTVSNMEVNGNSVTYEAAWPYELVPDYEYRGSLTYHLNNDGTLNHIERSYALVTPEGESEQTVDSITVMQEDAEATYAAIKAVADQCISYSELEAARYQEKLVSEIPSNKTMYDQDFALGAGMMRWYFHQEEYSFKIGCENPTPTSVTVFHTESVQASITPTAEESFWLEVFEDGQWRYVDENIKEVRDEVHSVSVSLFDGDRYTLDWADSYGALEPGFYRVGRYYTVSLPGKGEDTQVCYAKFRIYDENQEMLLQKCRSAFTTLLESKAYHVEYYELMESDRVSTSNEQYWKFGDNHMYRMHRVMKDGTEAVGGAMLRSGQGYSLTWEQYDVTKPLTNWTRADYMDKTNFNLWTWGFEIYDSHVVQVTEEGNQITVRSAMDRAETEIQFTFREDGSLASIQKTDFLNDGTYHLDASMKVLDTPAEEIKTLIDSQDVSKPPQFSWAEDKDKYPNAQTDGFKNTAKSAVKSMEDAIWLADKECTMEIQDTLSGERYNIVEVAYDPDAGIWRVFFQYSQNIEGDQYIYINGDGITVMVATT